uniref:Ribosomal protein S13 n=1 Tax=Ancoracysta twista TaxID=2044563 RepID=A0A2H4R8T3_9EUKA|nr:ribosomal protein S13 [Ancoracysta twista]ATY40918.1 ribosomal protein S13 [Ancoracysta twista]
MLYLFNTNLPLKKKTPYALAAIHGIGLSSGKNICEKAAVDPETPLYRLSNREILAISNIIQKEYLINVDLQRKVRGDIRRLMAISCNRGLRHAKSLPLRGQRTHTNGKTQKKIARKRYS